MGKNVFFKGAKKEKEKEKDGKEKDVMDLLCSEDFESIPFETESDALLLLNEISGTSNLTSTQSSNGNLLHKNNHSFSKISHS